MSDIADQWRAFQSRLDREYCDTKNSIDVGGRLNAEYSRLSPEERKEVDAEVGRWLGSEDEAVRFDAIGLIREQRITSALPELRVLAKRLELMATPGAPFEREKVLHLVEDLS